MEKFAINSVISATHSAKMDSEDKKDIISKINKSGEEETVEEPNDNSDENEINESWSKTKNILDKIGYNTNIISEAEYKGKNVELNSPKRGGSKKFYVYTKNSKGNVVKVSFGAKSGGGKLSVKINDPKKRKQFSERFDCKNKKDKTKPSYWSCRLPYYADKLGISGQGNYYW